MLSSPISCLPPGPDGRPYTTLLIQSQQDVVQHAMLDQVDGNLEIRGDVPFDASRIKRIAGSLLVDGTCTVRLSACVDIGGVVVACRGATIDAPVCQRVGRGIRARKGSVIDFPGCVELGDEIGDSVTLTELSDASMPSLVKVGGRLRISLGCALQAPKLAAIYADALLANGCIDAEEATHLDRLSIRPRGAKRLLTIQRKMLEPPFTLGRRRWPITVAAPSPFAPVAPEAIAATSPCRTTVRSISRRPGLLADLVNGVGEAAAQDIRLDVADVEPEHLRPPYADEDSTQRRVAAVRRFEDGRPASENGRAQVETQDSAVAVDRAACRFLQMVAQMAPASELQ